MSELQICPHCLRAVPVIGDGCLSAHSMHRRRELPCPLSGKKVEEPIIADPIDSANE